MLKFVLLALIFAYCNRLIIGGNTTTASLSLKTRCAYAPKLSLRNSNETEDCCRYSANLYAKRQWATGARYLTNFIENLKAWNCSQFYEECTNPTYDFTEFTKMVYTYFCSYDTFQSSCRADVESTLGVPINPKQNWTDALKLINATSLSDTEILNPCIQLAVYEYEALNETYEYAEIIHTAIPTCGWIWYGFHSKVIQERNISPWQIASVG